MYSGEFLDRLKAEAWEWEEQFQEAQQPGLYETLSGIPVKGVYTPADRADTDYLKDIGLPGRYPYTRGIHTTGYRGKLWTMRMFAGYGSAEETNTRFRYLLEQGQTGLSTAFDMPTLYGYDTDHPMALGEFGKCGVAVSSLADMELLFDGIPLDQVTTSMTINSPAAIIWAMYIATAQKRGIPMERLGGTLQNDILKEYTAQNEYMFPPGPSMRLVVDTIEFATRYMPRWNPVSVSGYHIREAGSTAVQELAFTLADGMEYVRWCLEREMPIDEFAPRLSFFFNVHNDFFEEIAKLRAARRIWARYMRETAGAESPRSWWMRFHTQTAGVSLTSQQPNNNIVRVALQALAAVLGGAQSLHTNSLDEAWALPSEEAVLVALRSQQIIAHETGVTSTQDPLGGSYYLESLTDEMERRCSEYFDRIQEEGGVLPAIETGFFTSEIARAAYQYQQELERKDRVIVGVNEYKADDELDIPLLRIDEESQQRHLDRLRSVRRERSSREVSEKLRNLEQVTRRGDNVMPALIDAVNAYCTLGEMMDVFRDIFGLYEPAWSA